MQERNRTTTEDDTRVRAVRDDGVLVERCTTRHGRSSTVSKRWALVTDISAAGVAMHNPELAELLAGEPGELTAEKWA